MPGYMFLAARLFSWTGFPPLAPLVAEAGDCGLLWCGPYSLSSGCWSFSPAKHRVPGTMDTEDITVDGAPAQVDPGAASTSNTAPKVCASPCIKNVDNFWLCYVLMVWRKRLAICTFTQCFSSRLTNYENYKCGNCRTRLPDSYKKQLCDNCISLLLSSLH